MAEHPAHGDETPAGQPGPVPAGPAASPAAQLRQIVLMVGTSFLALLVVLWLALDGIVTDSIDAPLPWILITVGVVITLVGVRWAREQPLRATAPDAFVGQFRTATFIGVAAAEVPGLLGFVAAFLIEAMWPFLVGVIPALIGLWLITPTPGRIRDLDRALRSRGRTFSASEALAAEPPGPRS